MPIDALPKILLVASVFSAPVPADQLQSLPLEKFTAQTFASTADKKLLTAIPKSGRFVPYRDVEKKDKPSVFNQWTEAAGIDKDGNIYITNYNTGDELPGGSAVAKVKGQLCGCFLIC